MTVNEGVSTIGEGATTVQRLSDCELMVARTFNGSARIVFEAWTQPDLFTRWWIPASFQSAILSREMDAHVGGVYRVVMQHPSMDEPMEFTGRYLEVAPHFRLTWTNDEGLEDGAVTKVTFDERGAETRVVLIDTYPSKEALDKAVASHAASGFSEQFEQLDELLAAWA